MRVEIFICRFIFERRLTSHMQMLQHGLHITHEDTRPAKISHPPEVLIISSTESDTVEFHILLLFSVPCPIKDATLAYTASELRKLS